MTFACQFGGAPKEDAVWSPRTSHPTSRERIPSRSHAKLRARYTLQYHVRPGANFRSRGSPGHGVLCVKFRRLKRHAATSAHLRVIASSCGINALVQGKDTGEKRQPCISPYLSFAKTPSGGHVVDLSA